MNIVLKSRNILYLLLSVAVLSFAGCTDSTDKQLQQLAKKANETCPKMLDQLTRLDSCAALPGNTFKYYQTVLGAVITDTTLFKPRLQPQILTMIKTSPDPVYKYFKEKDVTVAFQYNDEKGNYLFSVIVKPEDYKQP